jgi:Ca2+-transporting ATPase
VRSDSPESEVKDAQTLHFHAEPAFAVTEKFGVDPQHGLTSSEVEARRRKHGLNTLPSARQVPWWVMLGNQFASILVALLVGAAAVSFAYGDLLEGAAILAVVILNALVGFYTEFQAKQALDSLRDQTKTFARVRRDGRESKLGAEELVPGDVVELAAGDRIPADLRLIEAAAVKAEESALTGESLPTDKSANPVRAESLLAERSSMMYLGTSMVAGHALGIVTATGSNTELGKIGKLVTEVEESKTPLERRLADLGKRLAVVVVGIAVLVFAIGILRGAPLAGMVKVAISLAVAAIPEGMPAVTTLVLALGVMRMARQKAIVRKLAAVEALGGVTVIATDKTGTLTENRMTARVLAFADEQEVEVDEPTKLDPKGELAIKIGVLCNDASLKTSNEHLGDPTETALLEVAGKVGMDVRELQSANPRTEEIPFDSEAKWMATVHRTANREEAYVKGAPGTIVDMSDRYIGADGTPVELDSATRERLLELNRKLAARALRVLGLGYKAVDKDRKLDAGYVFVAFVGMIDPRRPEVRESIEIARDAGIRVVMMTGDQLMTGQAIATEVGMGDSPVAHHARDLAGASPERLATIAQSAQVFARVSPEDKLHIVEALQAAGEVVAVTGDGVNDAPALKRSDIGVAMGIRGTEVAKEAADVVLVDDNFATIVSAIKGGRTIYANIIKFVRFLFTCNLAEVVVVFSATTMGLPLPLFPLAILWVNLVTDVFPAFALAVEPAEPEIMKQRPRPPEEALLSKQFAIRVVGQSLLMGASTLAAYYWALVQYGEGAHARSVALLALVAVQAAQLFSARSDKHSAFRGILQSRAILAAAAAMALLQLLAAYVPFLAKALGIAPALPMDWAIVVAASLVPLAVDELIKVVRRLKSISMTS